LIYPVNIILKNKNKDNNITEIGIKEICEIFKNNTKLKFIDLRGKKYF
jgi:hypothetical protein